MTDRLDIEGFVRQLVVPIAAERGLTVVDVEFAKQAGHWFLRVYLDRKAGSVSLEDCTYVSEHLSPRLDVEDPIPRSYSLEVSSSGQKALRSEWEFGYFAGRKVRVKTHQACDGRRVFEGTLKGIKEGSVIVEVDGGDVAVPRESISSARLVFES